MLARVFKILWKFMPAALSITFTWSPSAPFKRFLSSRLRHFMCRVVGSMALRRFIHCQMEPRPPTDDEPRAR